MNNVLTLAVAKMSDTPKIKINRNCVISWILLLISISCACYFYHTCKESDNVSHDLTNWCFYICCWRVVSGIWILLAKSGYDAEHSGDKDSDSVAHCSSTLSELPLTVMSAISYKYMPDEVCQGPTTDDVLRSLFINNFFQVLPLLYRLIISRKAHCLNFTLHLATFTFAFVTFVYPIINCYHIFN